MEIITSHNNLDFDGLAAMVAASKLYPRAHKVVSGTMSGKVKRFVSLFKDMLKIKTAKEVPADEVTLLVVVDTMNAQRLCRFGAVARKPEVRLHLFDHHPESLGDLTGELVVREDVGAATTLLVERIQENGVPLTPFEATVMALGIYEDTGSLLFATTTARDLRAASFLRECGADLDTVARFMDQGLGPEQARLFRQLMESAEVHHVGGLSILLAVAEHDTFVSGLDAATYRLFEIQPVDAVFSIVRMENKVSVTARSRVSSLRVNEVLAPLGGRGHQRAAAAAVIGDPKAIAGVILEQIGRFASKALTAADIMSSPVKSVSASMTMEEAGRLMLRYGHTGMPVVSDGKMVGIISRRDVDKARAHKLGHAPVKGFMSSQVVSVSPQTPVQEVHRLMVENDIGRVPVIEDGLLVGIISRTDIIRTIHGDNGDIEDHAVLYLGEEQKEDLSSLIYNNLPRDISDILVLAGQVAEETGSRVYVVGGFVRDLLLGVANCDVDLVVEGDGLKFANALAARTGGRCRHHERFQTAVVILPDGNKVDVATARTEYYEFPAALPQVEASSIKEDLYRRDFTINTLAISLSSGSFGMLLDFFGGRRDLDQGLIRVLYNLSFIEDPTRIFRAIRFEKRFGFRIEQETLRLARDAVERNLIGDLSYKRVFQELVLILSERDPVPALERMVDVGVLPYVLPEVSLKQESWHRLRRLPPLLSYLEDEGLLSSARPWLEYFLVLVEGLDEKATASIVQRFPLDKRAVRAIRTAREVPALAARLAEEPDMACSSVYAMTCGLAPEAVVLLLLSMQEAGSFDNLTRCLRTIRDTRVHLKGDDFRRLGIKEGPVYERIKTDLRYACLDGLAKNRADEERLLGRWLSEGRYKLSD